VVPAGMSKVPTRAEMNSLLQTAPGLLKEVSRVSKFEGQEPRELWVCFAI
jgi:hypothetical protein